MIKMNDIKTWRFDDSIPSLSNGNIYTIGGDIYKDERVYLLNLINLI